MEAITNEETQIKQELSGIKWCESQLLNRTFQLTTRLNQIRRERSTYKEGDLVRLYYYKSRKDRTNQAEAVVMNVMPAGDNFMYTYRLWDGKQLGKYFHTLGYTLISAQMIQPKFMDVSGIDEL